MGHVTYTPEGRCGNALFQASAAMSYAWDHGMEFSMPTTSRSAKWAPVYCQHLARPDFDPSLPTITIEEKGYPFQNLAWEESWRDGNIVLNGFWQSEKYWSHHREEVLKAFGFPWELRPGFVAVHVRRGDYLVHTDKHPPVTKEWYDAQMAKFKGYKFCFLSDDLPYCKEQWGHRKDCGGFDGFNIDGSHDYFSFNPPEKRPEVHDLVLGSQCEHVIGSASTFAAWIYFLNRNPRKRAIFPKLWMVPGWESTTEETWRDVLPPEVERA